MKTKNTGPFLVQTPYLISETSNKCLWPRIARMEVAYDLYFARIIENLLWFALRKNSLNIFIYKCSRSILYVREDTSS